MFVRNVGNLVFLNTFKRWLYFCPKRRLSTSFLISSKEGSMLVRNVGNVGQKKVVCSAQNVSYTYLRILPGSVYSSENVITTYQTTRCHNRHYPISRRCIGKSKAFIAHRSLLLTITSFLHKLTSFDPITGANYTTADGPTAIKLWTTKQPYGRFCH
jgi:hypothetical protein